MEGIKTELLECLQYQRASARAVVDGLSEDRWHVPAVPSGWTVAGMIAHLGNAERHWFLGVVADADAPLPWDEGLPPYHPAMTFTLDRPPADVLAYYRAATDRADQVLAAAELSDPARGRHAGEPRPYTVSEVILHVIEETAAHTGHLEVARELLDGATGLGLR